MSAQALANFSLDSTKRKKLSPELQIQLRLLQWQKDAKKFVTEALRVLDYGAPNPKKDPQLEAWQAEALEIISVEDRLSIRAGHGVGKTALICWVVIWFACTRSPYKIPVTANSQDQLKDVVWPELRKWLARLPPEMRDEFDLTATHMKLKGSDECFAVARTASADSPEALQGFHSDNLLFVIEEASGIPDIVFEVAQGALSTEGAKVLMCANPTRGNGFFFKTHHDLRERWHPLRVNCEDVPRARGHIAEVVENYGKDSNVYRVRVLGEFPKAEEDAVIPLHLCETALARPVAPSDYYPVWGVDVARFGDDRTALAKRRGNGQMEPVKFWRQKDTMQVVGLVMAEYKLTQTDEGKDTDETPSEILVDVIGLGAGVVDRLSELGLPVRGVNVSEAAAVSDLYMRSRDELWFRAREWLSGGTAQLCKDDALIAELTSVKYGIRSTGKIEVEGKDSLKKRGLRSPDLADAFVLTFAGGLEKIRREVMDRYQRDMKRGRRGSWAAY